jgi:hypothetical protein
MRNIIILNIILGLCVVPIFTQTQRSQDKDDCCEYPSLGHFRILGKAPSELEDFYELQIGYNGFDKVEDCSQLGKLPLRGELLIINDRKVKEIPLPTVQLTGHEPAQNPTINVSFKKAELLISKKCKKRITIITEKLDNRYYIITATFLNSWLQEGGDLYKLVGTIQMYQNEKKIITYKAKFYTYGDY